MMKRQLPLLLLLISTAHAQTSPMADGIHQGRAALVAGQPEQARALFTAALAQPDGNRADTAAAALGLGQSSLWLGRYAAAATAFRMARAQADDAGTQQAADTGLAQALNAQDYPRQAYALVAPFAEGQPRPTLELLRAAQSLGWQDKTPAYLQAVTPPPATGYVGTQYQLLQDDVRYALSPQLQGSFDYSHDSDNLDTYQVGASFLSAPRDNGNLMQRWGVAAGSAWVDDPSSGRQLDDVALLAQLRIADSQYIDLAPGIGRSGSWQYLQGAARWTLQTSDSFSLSAAAERAPILTDTAIQQRLIDDTYSIGVSLRPAAPWYVLPTYYRQTFSDGNHRDGGTLRVLLSPFEIPDTAAAIGAELSTRVYHSSQPSRGTYFNPAHYSSTALGLVGVYSLDPRWKLRATADAGRQNIDGAGAGVYSVNVSLEGRLPDNGRLKFQIGRSSAASDSNGGTGYWNNSLMLSISYPL
ncbi:hypothetical protein [Rhodanobacter umsongensis]